MGVSILPRLAAMVCMAIQVSISRLDKAEGTAEPALSNKVIVRGTKVIKATSLVISMDMKKQSSMRIAMTP